MFFQLSTVNNTCFPSFLILSYDHDVHTLQHSSYPFAISILHIISRCCDHIPCSGFSHLNILFPFHASVLVILISGINYHVQGLGKIISYHFIYLGTMYMLIFLLFHFSLFFVFSSFRGCRILTYRNILLYNIFYLGSSSY